jgi:hypothetical protein
VLEEKVIKLIVTKISKQVEDKNHNHLLSLTNIYIYIYIYILLDKIQKKIVNAKPIASNFFFFFSFMFTS